MPAPADIILQIGGSSPTRTDNYGFAIRSLAILAMEPFGAERRIRTSSGWVKASRAAVTPARHMVPAEGLEPSIPAASGFKPDVYTNSTIQAYLVTPAGFEPGISGLRGRRTYH